MLQKKLLTFNDALK